VSQERRCPENLHYVKQLGTESKIALEQGALRRFAELMHVHWEHKKRRSPNISNPKIDEYYELAQHHGGQAEIVSAIQKFRERCAVDPSQPLSAPARRLRASTHGW
jgi:galactokinase/mevalonate kinase-like predicted kinase